MRKRLMRRLARMRHRSPRLDRPPATFEELRARALEANPFESDDEVDELIAWAHAERQRDVA